MNQKPSTQRQSVVNHTLKAHNLRELKDSFYQVVGFLRHILRQFNADGCFDSAQALTYTTLFAVVPMMTVTYSMLATIPSLQGVGEQIQTFIFENFVPATGEALQAYIQQFAIQARKLTLAGIAFLLLTAVLLMIEIERKFNAIWRVSESRKGLGRFLLYWAVLTLGPLLMGIGVILTSYLTSLSIFTDAAEMIGGRQRLLGYLPWALSIAAFTLLYIAVPYCKVLLRHAFIGGLLMGTLFEGAKAVFAWFVSITTYTLIYGTFAAVPLFLLWIYVSWLIVLLGAEMVHSLGTYRPRNKARNVHHFLCVLSILERFWYKHRQGDTVTERDILEHAHGLEPVSWNYYSGLLINQKIIQRTDLGEYVLRKDLATVTLWQLHQCLPWPLPCEKNIKDFLSTHNQWDKLVFPRLKEVEQYNQQQLDVDLQHLFSHAQAKPLAGPAQGLPNDPVNDPVNDNVSDNVSDRVSDRVNTPKGVPVAIS